MTTEIQSFLEKVRGCTLCAGELDRPPNPILQAGENARILIAGQAPGNLADIRAKPFCDPSGVRLREWMGVTEDEFYDETRMAILPMGFCFPGYDAKGGDRPPMKICAPTWREALLARLPKLSLTLAIGSYAQAWHLGTARKRTMTETVKDWRSHIERGVLPMPHPSWRNNGWLKRNPWFETELLPVLRQRVRALL